MIEQSYNIKKGVAPRADLEAEYLFSNNANDTSGKAKNGTASNVTYVKDSWSRATKAAEFNGTSSNIDLNWGTGENLKTSNHTFSMWIKVDATGTGQPRIFDNQNNIIGLDAFAIYADHSGNTIGSFVRDSAGVLNSISIPIIFEYVHIAVTFESGVMKMYADGQYIDSYTLTASNYIMTQDYHLGYVNYDTSAYFKGELDDIRIYSRALSAFEIKNLYYEVSTEGYTLLERGLEAKYLFNGNVNDSWNNGYNGTNNGADLTLGRYGGVDKAYDYIPANLDYIAMPYSYLNSQNIVTVGVRFKVDSSGIYGIVAMRGTGSIEIKFLIAVVSGNILLQTSSSTSLLTVATSAKTYVGEWVDVIGTINHTTQDYVLCINGGAEYIYGNNTNMINPTIDGFDVGRNDVVQYMDGKIDEVWVWSKELTGAEQRANYNRPPETWRRATGDYIRQLLSIDDTVLTEFVSGTPIMKLTQSGTVEYQNISAYGEWSFYFKKTSAHYSNIFINLVDNSGQKYVIMLSATNVLSLRIDTTNLFSTATDVFDDDIWYQIYITRNSTLNEYVTGAIGTFAVYIRGGTFGNSYTLVPTTGSNPILNNTYTISTKYIIEAYYDDEFSGINIPNGEVSII